jgi:serine/threonine protein kinase
MTSKRSMEMRCLYNDYTVFRGELQDVYYKQIPIKNLGLFIGDKNLMVDEITAYEKLSVPGHPNLCRYYGWVSQGDRVEEIQHDIIPACRKQHIFRQQLRDREDNKCHCIHGDINYNNIMFDDTGEPVLIDFDSSGANFMKKGTEGWMMIWTYWCIISNTKNYQMIFKTVMRCREFGYFDKIIEDSSDILTKCVENAHILTNLFRMEKHRGVDVGLFVNICVCMLTVFSILYLCAIVS